MPMTADEIKNALEDSRSEKGWIKELCWQMAHLNEKPKYAPDPNFSEVGHVPHVDRQVAGEGQKRKYVRRQA